MRDKHGHHERGHREQREMGERKEHQGHRHGHGHRHGTREHPDHHPRSAQTFRRGRAVAFLDILAVKRDTLQRQLNDPNLDSIKQVISGEFKATDAIIQEFIHVFQLYDVQDEPAAASAGEAPDDGLNGTDQPPASNN